MPAIDSVKLDVFANTMNSLISIQKAIKAPNDIFNMTIHTSRVAYSSHLLKTAKNGFPVKIFVISDFCKSFLVHTYLQKL